MRISQTENQLDFHFFIGGYSAGHFEVKLIGDELRFLVDNYPMPCNWDWPTHVVPVAGDEDWLNLVKHIEGLKWKRQYHTLAMDGIQWSLEFSNDKKKIRSHGSNAFPEDFDAFTALLQKITSRHQIPDGLIHPREL